MIARWSKYGKLFKGVIRKEVWRWIMFDEIKRELKRAIRNGKLKGPNYGHVLRKITREIKREKNRLKKLLGPELIEEKQKAQQALRLLLQQELDRVHSVKPVLARAAKKELKKVTIPRIMKKLKRKGKKVVKRAKRAAKGLKRKIRKRIKRR